MRCLTTVWRACGRVALHGQCGNPGLRRIASVASATQPQVQLHETCAIDRSTLPVEFGGDIRAIRYDALTRMHPVGVAGLSGVIFNAPIRKDLVHRSVVWQRACARAGTASTKSRGEVSGSGKKIRPQKGTGQSRQGDRKSPIFRGGGRAHGPKPRDWSYPLPMLVQLGALRSVLSSKLQCGQLWIVDDVTIPESKTRICLDSFRAMGWQSALVLDHVPDTEHGIEPTLYRACSNIQRVRALSVDKINCYDLVRFDTLVMTTSAVDRLTGRFDRYNVFA